MTHGYSCQTYKVQDQSVIEISMVAVDDVSPSGVGGFSEIRELVGIQVVVAPHGLTPTKPLTEFHISGGWGHMQTHHFEKNTTNTLN